MVFAVLSVESAIMDIFFSISNETAHNSLSIDVRYVAVAVVHMG